VTAIHTLTRGAVCSYLRWLLKLGQEFSQTWSCTIIGRRVGDSSHHLQIAKPMSRLSLSRVGGLRLDSSRAYLGHRSRPPLRELFASGPCHRFRSGTSVDSRRYQPSERQLLSPSSPPAVLTNPLSCHFGDFHAGDVPAQVLFAGLAPGLVGYYQVDVRVPDNVPVNYGDAIIACTVSAQPPFLYNSAFLPVKQ
jgi:hypothetical protein